MRAKTVVRFLLAAFFALAGLNHFLRPGIYLKIMPPYLPWPLALVYLSGLAEAGLGLALPVPKLRKGAAWGLAALLLAVFPANVHMALHAGEYPVIRPWMLWARLPMQFVLIALVLWSAKEESRAEPARRRRAL